MRGPDFYDDDAVFATYSISRERPDNPNDTLEQPVLRELVGNLAGLRVLDLGCGAGSFGAYAIASGCRAYTGIDGSKNMVQAARKTLAGTSGSIIFADLASWSIPRQSFDVVASSLTLHYLEEIDSLLRQIYHALPIGGRFVFSVEHPVITSSDRGWGAGPRQTWLVDDYFAQGKRETAWLGRRVIKYHRTVETYYQSLQAAGFIVDRLRESHPSPEHFTVEAEYERRMRIPLFLFICGSKYRPGV